jgi:hypothetical protein
MPAKLVTLRAGTVGANAGDGTTLQLDSSANAVDDFYNGCLLVGTLDSNVEARVISDYAGSTKVCTVSPAFVTTPDNNDTFVVYQPWGRQVGEAHVNAIVANGITATSIASDAITDAKVASDVTIASVTGAVGSVTGAVGSVTGAVGSIGAGGIANASFANDAITASKLHADVTTELQSGLATQTSVDDLPTNAELATALGTADDAVLAQIALVKAKTDSLTFTVAGQVDANIQYVNDVEVQGDGEPGTEWGPA